MWHTLLFDMDDTLVNTSETIMKRIDWLIKTYSLNPSDRIYIYNLLSNPDRVAILSDKYAFAENVFVDYEKLRKIIVVSPLANIRSLFDDIRAKNINVGILTNTEYEKTKFKLSRCCIYEDDLGRLFYHSGNLPYLKPDSRCFGILPAYLRNKGLLYIGDSLIDYAAADGAGVGFIAVTSGMTSRDEFVRVGLYNNRILDNVAEITKIIDEIPDG